jgi:hypothetical protein
MESEATENGQGAFIIHNRFGNGKILRKNMTLRKILSQKI